MRFGLNMLTLREKKSAWWATTNRARKRVFAKKVLNRFTLLMIFVKKA